MVIMITAYIYSMPDTIKSTLHGLSHLNPHPDPMMEELLLSPVYRKGNRGLEK